MSEGRAATPHPWIPLLPAGPDDDDMTEIRDRLIEEHEVPLRLPGLCNGGQRVCGGRRGRGSEV